MMGNNIVTIEVTGIHLFARHGVMPQERAVGNEFVVDLLLEIDATPAVEQDSLDGTVNYAEAIELVREQMGEPSQLLEHVAGRIRNALLKRWPAVKNGYVRVSKPHAPVGAQVENVSVRLNF